MSSWSCTSTLPYAFMAVLYYKIIELNNLTFTKPFLSRWTNKYTNYLLPFISHNFFFVLSKFSWSIPLACAQCDVSLPFSGASSIPLCYVLFPATLLHQLFFHTLSPHLAIYFLVYLSVLLFPNSYIIPFREFYFLPFSVHAQTNVIYLILLSLL